MRKIEIVSDGLRLAGEVRVPVSPDSDRPFPAVVICHGIPAVPFNPEEKGYSELADRFAVEGFVVVTFNFRGAGLSEGDFDMRGWVRDLSQAVTYVTALDVVDVSSVFLLGFSGGAAASLCVAAVDERVSGVVSCASPADFRELMQGSHLEQSLARWREIGIVRDTAFPYDMAEWASGFDEVAPVGVIDRISPRPVLLLHGDADEVVDVSHAHELYCAAQEPKQLVVIPEGIHRLRVDEQAMSTAIDWLHAQHRLTLRSS
ncbi:MAG: alpha/beta fold hydrolase [Dehalococcoidia bacterium]|nr:alpha/beta fold hydrolase [Dehalococcoidia bacterium]